MTPMGVAPWIATRYGITSRDRADGTLAQQPPHTLLCSHTQTQIMHMLLTSQRELAAQATLIMGMLASFDEGETRADHVVIA